MKSEEIKRLVAKSENAAVEFKRARGGVPADFWPSYSSFAKTDGGVIILGVREKEGKREIEGLADTETFFSLVRIGERSGMGLSSLYGTWEKEHFAAPSIVESYEPDRTKVLVEFESDDSELGVKTSEVGVIDFGLGVKPSEVGVKHSELGVIGLELGVKDSEVGEKKAISEGENAEVKEKTGVSDDVKAASDDVKTGSVHEKQISDHVKSVSDDVNHDFEVLMGAYRSDFRENARKVLYAFAETPEADISSVAKGLGFSAKSVWRAIRAMKEVGLLVREGGDKGGKWIVKKAGL